MKKFKIFNNFKGVDSLDCCSDIKVLRNNTRPISKMSAPCVKFYFPSIFAVYVILVSFLIPATNANVRF